MANTFKLNLISPDRKSMTFEVVSLATKNKDGIIEFLANYTPIICSTIPSITKIVKSDGSKMNIFTSTGIISIKDNVVNFCCDSINLEEEIDKARAEKARERAIKRLKENRE